MPRYSKRSKERLASCDQRLQEVFNEVIKHVDCSILEGHRSKERQNKLYDEGRTKVKYPNGRHNSNPSKACDVTPYPVDWKDRERQTLFAGFVLGLARSMGYICDSQRSCGHDRSSHIGKIKRYARSWWSF